MITVDVAKDAWDYVALMVATVAAAATVWAVWSSVRDSRRANMRAVKAEDEVQRLQAKQEDDRILREVMDWARLQAVDVLSAPGILSEVTGDLHGQFTGSVINHSNGPIRDVIVSLEIPGASRGIREQARFEEIPAGSTVTYLGGGYVGDTPVGSQPRIAVLFKDKHQITWHLRWDGSLRMAEARSFGIEPLSDYFNDSACTPTL